VIVGGLLDLFELELAGADAAERGATEHADVLAEYLLAASRSSRARAAELGSLIEDLGGSPSDDADRAADRLPHRAADLSAVRDHAELRSLVAEQSAAIGAAYRAALRMAGIPDHVRATLTRLSETVG
jgi:hypothetical protein